MLAYLLSTWRTARRLPALWLLAAAGVAALAAGLSLSILALSADPEGARRLAGETALGTAAVATLWLLARAFESDARSGFTLAADQTRGGPRARLLGRWAGAVLAGAAASLPTGVAAWLWTGTNLLLLLLTTIGASALLGAWAALGAALGLGGVALLLAGGALWVLGHLPWGAEGFGGGGLSWVAAWLPPGSAPAGGGPSASGLLALAGLLLLTLAVARPLSASGRTRPVP